MSLPIPIYPSNTTEYAANVHIRVKVNGASQKCDFFDWLLGELDSDWPGALPTQRRTGAPPFEDCPKCNGGIYKQPTFSADEIRGVAAQIHATRELPGNLKIKIKSLIKESVCEQRT